MGCGSSSESGGDGAAPVAEAASPTAPDVEYLKNFDKYGSPKDYPETATKSVVQETCVALKVEKARWYRVNGEDSVEMIASSSTSSDQADTPTNHGQADALLVLKSRCVERTGGGGDGGVEKVFIPIIETNGKVVAVLEVQGLGHEDETRAVSFAHAAYETIEKCSESAKLLQRTRSGDMLTSVERSLSRNLKDGFYGPSFVNNIAVTAQDLLRAKSCTFYILDVTRSLLWNTIGDKGIHHALPRDSGIVGRTLSANAVVIVNGGGGGGGGGGEDDTTTVSPTESILLKPVSCADGSPMGVIKVVRDMVRPFDDSDSALLDKLCSLAASTSDKEKLGAMVALFSMEPPKAEGVSAYALPSMATRQRRKSSQLEQSFRMSATIIAEEIEEEEKAP